MLVRKNSALSPPCRAQKRRTRPLNAISVPASGSLAKVDSKALSIHGLRCMPVCRRDDKGGGGGVIYRAWTKFRPLFSSPDVYKSLRALSAMPARVRGQSWGRRRTSGSMCNRELTAWRSEVPVVSQIRGERGLHPLGRKSGSSCSSTVSRYQCSFWTPRGGSAGAIVLPGMCWRDWLVAPRGWDWEWPCGACIPPSIRTAVEPPPRARIARCTVW